MNNKKILVTGGAGYIGSFMVRELEFCGFTPVILDDFSSGHRKAVSEYKIYERNLVHDNLDDIFKSEDFIGVVHMASFIQMGESYVNPSKYYRNNVGGFLNLIDTMVKFNVKNIIFSSSAGVYGNPLSVPISENDIKNPLNPYGETKYIIERILDDYETAHDIKYMSIRYFNASGAMIDGTIGEAHPEESHLIPNLIAKTLTGEEVSIFGNDYDTPDGTCIRDYIHVLDLVKTHSLAMEKLILGSRSNIYNAGIGRGYSNKEVIEMVEQVTGKKVNTKYVEKRKGDASQLFASIDKIKKELSWKPNYGLKEIIESAYLWHKSHPIGYRSS